MKKQIKRRIRPCTFILSVSEKITLWATALIFAGIPLLKTLNIIP